MYLFKVRIFTLKNNKKKIEDFFLKAVEIAHINDISFEKLVDLLALLYKEDE